MVLGSPSWDAIHCSAAPTRHVVGIDRPIEALQAQLTNVRRSHRMFDFAEYPVADHDLAGLGLAAQAGGEIYDAADRSVFAAGALQFLGRRRFRILRSNRERLHGSLTQACRVAFT
jgi:hypothetical protein